jgi:hypothetical protein
VTTPFLQPAGPEIARRSTNSNPALTADAVRLVTAAVRSGALPPPCEQTTLPARGAVCKAIGP